MANVMKGKPAADAVCAELVTKIKEMKAGGVYPRLCIVRVGAKPEDLAYERGARKRMEAVGVDLYIKELPEDITPEDFVSEFRKINEDPKIHGIMVFLPLPRHLRGINVAGLIAPEKDVDGMSPINAAKVFSGDKSGFAPCTAEAVMVMLEHYGIGLAGKRVTVVGRSMVVGRPLAMLMLQKNATVKICHTGTADLALECRDAEVVVAAAGKAEMITGDMISKGAVVADVGINVNAEGNMCGDVAYEPVSKKALFISPVPGGVGSVTTSVLAMHVVRAAEMQTGGR